MNYDISDSRPIGVLAAMLPEDYRDNLVRLTLGAVRHQQNWVGAAREARAQRPCHD